VFVYIIDKRVLVEHASWRCCWGEHASALRSTHFVHVRFDFLGVSAFAMLIFLDFYHAKRQKDKHLCSFVDSGSNITDKIKSI
jgi:hypothetical protein